MSTNVRGEFRVTMTPLEASPSAGEAGVHRMSPDKRYLGALEAVGRGEMLAAHGGVEGSAGYVALERITGTLLGRSGGFVVQHHGLMDRGEPSLSITVVPDSGTDGLAGISGKMGITIADGKHFYEFEYDLADAS